MLVVAGFLSRSRYWRGPQLVEGRQYPKIANRVVGRPQVRVWADKEHKRT